MKSLLKKYNIQIRILIPILIGIVVLCFMLYYFIPGLLNYPIGTWDNMFQKEINNTNLLNQIVLLAITMMFIFIITTFLFTGFLKKYNELLLSDKNNLFINQINYVKNKLFFVPNKLYIWNMLLLHISIVWVYYITIHKIDLTTIKIIIASSPFIVIFVSFTNMYIKYIFNQLLNKLPGDELKFLKKTSLKKKALFNIFPLVFASLLLFSICGYSKIVKEKGDALFEAYKTELSYFSKNNSFININDLILKANQDLSLVGANDYVFVRTPKNDYINSQNRTITMSTFFDKYLNELSQNNDGRVYEYYGIDCQAASQIIYINDTAYIVGIYYHIIDASIVLYYAIIVFIILIINCFVLVQFSKSIANNISLITKKLNTIANSKNIIHSDKLTVTSNDEIADLINAYNKTQSLATTNIKQIALTKEALSEQERLASLGQMIGGISHNLKTPIFSIAGGIEGLNNLINEFDQSIDNPSVNNNDMHDIAKDMLEWTSKIKDYTSYMSDVITAVKGQAVNLSNEDVDYFTTTQLFKYVDLLMKHELKNALVDLVINNNVDDSYFIKGSINGLVQVINNIISNAIQVYEGQANQSIIMSAKIHNNRLLISIQDFGPGISPEVQNKLFKEMITTKGKNGTGLGLFMSYSNIKAHYHGQLYYQTELGKGTTFYIELPIENRKKI